MLRDETGARPPRKISLVTFDHSEWEQTAHDGNDKGRTGSLDEASGN